MNNSVLYEAIGLVKDEYLAEAENYTNGKKNAKYIRWCGLAACFGAMVLFAHLILPRSAPSPAPLPSDGTAVPPPPVQGNTGTSPPPANDPIEQPQEPDVIITLDDITVNELESLGADMGFKYYSPEEYTELIWDMDSVSLWLGWDVDVPYLPEGITPSPHNPGSWVIADLEGNVVLDQISLGFYDGYDDEGYPLYSDAPFTPKGFSITASKLGFVSDCLYTLPEDEVKESNIYGTDVIFGYRSMPYGPYDPDTHEPSGHYDLYTADFSFLGADYQIVFRQMEFEEVLKVTCSILTGTEK